MNKIKDKTLLIMKGELWVWFRTKFEGSLLS